MSKLILVIITILFISCSPKVSTKVTKTLPALEFNKEVTVFNLYEDMPADAIEIGTIKIGDTGFSVNCGWDVVIEKAKTKAREAGGNALKITSHRPPSALGSSCDRITAKILQVSDLELANYYKNESAVVDSSWNYAKLYVYRPPSAGVLIGYDVYLGDSVICRMSNRDYYEIQIKKKGYNSLWAKTESKSEVPIDIEFGKEYYLRCTMGMGVMIGRPELRLVNNKTGRAEYLAMKKK